MTCSKMQLWGPFQRHYSDYPEIGLGSRVSRINFPDGSVHQINTANMGNNLFGAIHEQRTRVTITCHNEDNILSAMKAGFVTLNASYESATKSATLNIS